MPTYRPPQQILFEPVTSFYRGKAIRQKLEAGEQDIEFRSLQIKAAKQELKDAPAKKKAAEQKAAADYDLVLANVRKRNLEVGELEMDQYRDAVGPWIVEFGKKSEDDPAAALDWANDNFPSVIERLPEDRRDDLMKMAGEDHVFSFDEMASAGLGVAIYEVDKDPDPTSHQKHLQVLVDAGHIPQERMNELLEKIEVKAGTAQPLVTINQGGETAATKSYGRGVGEAAAKRNEQALATHAEDTNLSRLELAIARGARTGFGESVILDIRGALDTMGAVPFAEGAAESEIVRSIGNILALRLRNPASGLGLTGNTSNKDLVFLKDSVAGISRSEPGNLLLIKMAKKLNQFKRDLAARQADIINNNAGSVPIDLDNQLMQFANGYEMFTKRERDEISGLVKQDGPATPIADASNDSILGILGLPRG